MDPLVLPKKDRFPQDVKSGPKEMMGFDEDALIIKRAGEGFLEFQFEELRLKDYTSKAIEREFGAFAMLDDGNLGEGALEGILTSTPTINTRAAIEDVDQLFAGTPTVNISDTALIPPCLQTGAGYVQTKQDNRKVLFADEKMDNLPYSPGFSILETEDLTAQLGGNNP